jgi:SIR2-like domain
MTGSDFIGGPIVNDQENAHAIDALRRRLTENPNIIPFVGAGVSRPFGYPDWLEFLQEGADLAGKRSEVDDLVGQGDYESAMSVIHRELEGIKYFDFLRDTFGPREASGATWNATVQFLPAMPKTPIVTTNIDGVLEQVFEEHGSPLEVIVGARRDRIRVAIEEKQRCLIKLHGDYRDQDDRILTLEDYEKHYGSGTRTVRKQQPFLGIVQNLLAGNSFLFLGFGMEERTKRLLQSVAEGGGLHSHWILLRRSSRSSYRERAKELGRSNVRTLWYDDVEHLGAFLHWFTYTAAPADSPLRDFYSAIETGNYSKALASGKTALDNGFNDPALIWDISFATELAARRLLGQGELTEGLRLLKMGTASHGQEAQSAIELRWAISYTLNLAFEGAEKPAEVRTRTLETLSLLREAVVNPSVDLLSDSRYQEASRRDIAEALKTLCLLSRASQADSSEIEVFSSDSLVQAARNAAMLQQQFTARAADVDGRLRRLKEMYYQYRAKNEEFNFDVARRAIAVRQVASLDDLRTRRKWYGEH